MDLSIIIPSYNTRALLAHCLTSINNSLINSNLTYEIIVVDNASTDGTSQFLRKEYPQVQLVCNKVNVGYGRANNRGIHKAKGKYILLLNSDIVVQQEAIGSLYRFIKEKRNAFAGGKLYNIDGSFQPSCGPFFSLPLVMLMLFAKGDYWGATRFSPVTTRSVDWVSGACLMGEKKAFEAVGLFDEKIFMYMEDIDFLYRAKQKGYDVYCFAGAHFVHTGSGSSGHRSTPVVNIYRGLMYFYRKHHGPGACAAIRLMLLSKALAAIIAGRMMGKQDLIDTYEKAIGVV